jgi:hypothetical protein
MSLRTALQCGRFDDRCAGVFMDDLTRIAVALFSIGFGLVACFFGFRIFRLVLSIIGIILGASIGLALTADSTQLTQILVALAGGLIGAVVMNALYFLGVVIAGAWLGALAANLLVAALGIEPNVIFLVIGAVVGGVVALVLNKLMIILSTAFSGAAGVIYGLTLIFPSLGGFDPLGALSMINAEQGEASLILLVAWIILGVAGVGIQYRASEELEEQAGVPA